MRSSLVFPRHMRRSLPGAYTYDRLELSSTRITCIDRTRRQGLKVLWRTHPSTPRQRFSSTLASAGLCRPQRLRQDHLQDLHGPPARRTKLRHLCRRPPSATWSRRPSSRARRPPLAEVVTAQEVKRYERLVSSSSRRSPPPSSARARPPAGQYGHAQDRFERLGGYELELRARQILSGLGLRRGLDKPAEDFSGGWQMRISLSYCSCHPDLLMLTSPAWPGPRERQVARVLSPATRAVLLVSHDRAFMDAH